MTTTDVVIAVDNLVKDYRGLRPLRLKQFAVQAGQRVAIAGVDATAAEVLVNLINGAILPDEGDVQVFGQSTRAIEDETAWFASLDRFGIVTPRAVLLEASTVAQNLALPFTIELDAIPAEVRARGEALAREVGLAEELIDKMVGELPGVARMRIHLARALANDPHVLLLEHPTVPMDRADVAGFAVSVRDAAERRQIALVAITEDAAFAEVVAPIRYRLQGGTGVLASASGWRRWFQA